MSTTSQGSPPSLDERENQYLKSTLQALREKLEKAQVQLDEEVQSATAAAQGENQQLRNSCKLSETNLKEPVLSILRSYSRQYLLQIMRCVS